MGHANNPSCDTLLVLGLPHFDADNPPNAECRVLRKRMDRRRHDTAPPPPATKIPNKQPWQDQFEAPIGHFVDATLSLSLSYDAVSPTEVGRGHINSESLYYQSSSAPLAQPLQYGASYQSPTSTSTFSNSCLSSGGGGVKRHMTDVDGASGSKSEAEGETEVDKVLATAGARSGRRRGDGTAVAVAAASASGKKKLRMTTEMVAILEEEFEKQTTLNTLQKEHLAEKLGIETQQVVVWFQNRRARNKQKQIELECDALKEHCNKLDEENRRLKTELRELHSAIRITGPPAQATATLPAYPPYMLNPTTVVCPACYKISATATAGTNTVKLCQPSPHRSCS